MNPQYGKLYRSLILKSAGADGFEEHNCHFVNL